MENKRNNDKSFEDALKEKYMEDQQTVSSDFWNALDQKLEEKKIYNDSKVVRLPVSKYLFWAAAAVLPFLLSFPIWFFLFRTSVNTATTSHVSAPRPVTKVAEDTAAGKKVLVTAVPEKTVATAPEPRAGVHKVYACKEGTKTFMLPDSSKVYLNHSSRLVYVSQRKVTLAGEAFFEVQHNPAVKFHIQTETAEITVLGTSFNVHARDRKKMQVSVYTGMVALYGRNGNGKEITLSPGMTGTLEPNGKISVKQEEDLNLLSWKENVLSFNNTPLSQVKDILQRHFNVSIELTDAALGNCTFTGTFKKPELQKILNIIGATLNIQYEYKDGTYLFTGKGCN
jgi:ferric-dicitrate binding protein FerR (iron transport regulator)